MKIILINPPTTYNIRSHVPKNVTGLSSTIPPLGLLYLAAACKDKYNIEIIDSTNLNNSYKELRKLLVDKKPDIVGITTLTAVLIDSIKTSKMVKELFPKCKVILGGAHITIYPKESMYNSVDFTLSGECELTFPALINAIILKKGFENISGLTYRKDGDIIINPIGKFIENLDELKFPARDLIDNSKYYSVLSSNNPIATMITSRGCPYQCIYCDRNNNGRKFRARSVKNVVDEMEICKSLGIGEIFFIDDTFTIDKERVIGICKEIIFRKLIIHWDIRSRINTMDEQMLEYLKKAGVTRIHYGIESGSFKVLKAINKKISLKRTVEIIKATKKMGIGILGYFMIGCPEEKYEDFEKTVDLACKLPLDYAQFSITTPYPSTLLYSKALLEGLYNEDHWKKFVENPDEKFIPPYYTENFSEEELIEMCNIAHKKYYGRFSYILRSLVKIKSFSEFKIKLNAGLRVLGIKK